MTESCSDRGHRSHLGSTKQLLSLFSTSRVLMGWQWTIFHSLRLSERKDFLREWGVPSALGVPCSGFRKRVKITARFLGRRLPPSQTLSALSSSFSFLLLEKRIRGGDTRRRMKRAPLKADPGSKNLPKGDGSAVCADWGSPQGLRMSRRI